VRSISFADASEQELDAVISASVYRSDYSWIDCRCLTARAVRGTVAV